MCVHVCSYMWRTLSHTATSIKHGKPNYGALRGSHVNRNKKFIWHVVSFRHLCHGSPWPIILAHGDSAGLYMSFLCICLSLFTLSLWFLTVLTVLILEWECKIGLANSHLPSFGQICLFQAPSKTTSLGQEPMPCIVWGWGTFSWKEL